MRILFDRREMFFGLSNGGGMQRRVENCKIRIYISRKRKEKLSFCIGR